jgi:hypothetical protein
MQLSPNFSLKEMTHSDAATRLGRPVVASAEIQAELARLCNEVLQPIRHEIALMFGTSPIIVSSGYRPLWLNQLIGGSLNSAHIYGRAADFQVIGHSNYEIANFIAGFIHTLPIDQLIYEFGDWVHVATPAIGVEPRRQILTAIRNPKTGKVEYPLGIIKQEEN